MSKKDLENYLFSIQRSGFKLELERIKLFLKSINNPEKDIKSILITGTNGKGSVSTFLSSILLSLGYKTGLFTSPHLVEVNERIRVNNKKIPYLDLERIVFYIKEHVNKAQKKGILPNRLTFFETMTVASFLYFKEQKVDFGVFEIGLGGRLDATNVLEPLASAITTISYDHTRILGKSLTKIAREKAGIIKDGKPVIIGRLPKHTLPIIKNIVTQKNALLIKAFDKKNRLFLKKDDCFMYKTEKDSYKFKPKLLGKHQGENAAIAIKIYENLSVFDKRNNKNVIKGIEEAFIEGRLEIYNDKIIFDGAHNIDGIKRLTEFLKNHGLKNLCCLFGVSQGKKIDEMGKLLFPFCKKIVLTKANIYRAEEPERIYKKFKSTKKVFEIELDLRKAVEKVLNNSKDKKILITGSLYLVGDVKKVLNEINK